MKHHGAPPPAQLGGKHIRRFCQPQHEAALPSRPEVESLFYDLIEVRRAQNNRSLAVPENIQKVFRARKHDPTAVPNRTIDKVTLLKNREREHHQNPIACGQAESLAEGVYMELDARPGE